MFDDLNLMIDKILTKEVEKQIVGDDVAILYGWRC